MNNLVINSGSMTAAGNLTGYSLTKGRVHIFGKQLEASGIKPDALKFPLYVTADKKDIPQGSWDAARTVFTPEKDAEGNVKVTPRLTALHVFKTRDEMINAHVEEATITLDINQALVKKAVSAGLTDVQAAALVAELDF